MKHDIVATFSQLTASLMDKGLSALQEGGIAKREAGVCLSMAGTVGILQAFASLVGVSAQGKAFSDASAVNNDSILLGALLAVASCDAHAEPSVPDAVAVQLDPQPATYLRALEMFRKITGRDGESVMHPDLVAFAHADDSMAATMLANLRSDQRPN